MSERSQVQVSFADAFRFLLRGLLPALVVGAAAAAIAFVVSREPEPLYRATAVLLATRPGTAVSNQVNVIEPAQVDPAVYRSAVVQGGLMETALAAVLGASPVAEEMAEWRRRIRVRVDENLISGLVHIDVDHEEPELAAAIADSLAAALLAWDRDRVVKNVQATVTALSQTVLVLGAQIAAAESAGDESEAQQLRATRDQRIAQLRSAEALNLSAVVMGLLEPFRDAVVDPRPVNDRTVFVAAVTFVLFFLLVYVLLFFRAASDTRVRGARDLLDATGLRAAALVPVESKQAAFRDAIERLSGALHLRTHDDEGGLGKVVAVTSPTSSAERFGLAGHLATVLAEAGLTVLLVDADLEAGALSAASPTARHAPTLVELLTSPGADRAGTFSSGPGRRIHFIAAGDVPVAGGTVMLGRRIGGLIEEWRERFDVIVLDTAAIAESTGTLAVAREADVTLLAVARLRTQAEAAKDALAQLEGAGVADVVAALTNAEPGGGGARSPRAEGGRRAEQAPYRRVARATVTHEPRGD